MHWMSGAVFGLMAFAGTAAHAQDRGEPVAGASFSVWGTGSRSYFYHRLTGDCDTVDHGHGRNAAWGRWLMPLSRIIEAGPEEGEHRGAVLRFRCEDGTECIRRGQLDNVTGRTGEHVIPFETMEGARSFAQQVAELKVACGVAR